MFSGIGVIAPPGRGWQRGDMWSRLRVPYLRSTPLGPSRRRIASLHHIAENTRSAERLASNREFLAARHPACWFPRYRLPLSPRPLREPPRVWHPPIDIIPASRRRIHDRPHPLCPQSRPATCTSAASARRCSTGCSPGSTAASSSCASTTPISERNVERGACSRSSTASAGWASTGTKGPRSADRTAPIISRSGWTAIRRPCRTLLDQRAGLSRLRHDRGAAGRARGGRDGEAAVPLQPPLDGRDAGRAGRASRPRAARPSCG